MKKVLLVVSLYFLTAGFLSAQSAEKIEEILKSSVLTNGQACYLAGTAAGIFEDSASYETAFAKFKHLKGFRNTSSNDAVRLDGFSNLILSSAGIKGSLWYMAAKNPHYALRYLKNAGVLDKDALPSAVLTPREAMAILLKSEGLAK